MKVFVDGQYGTTGLKIHERLNQRNDVELLSISEEHKKDPEIRIKVMNEADIVFLCLPDQAAREALTLIMNPNTRVIDSSTAFRTNDAVDLWIARIIGFTKRRDSGRCSCVSAGRPATLLHLYLRLIRLSKGESFQMIIRFAATH